MEPFVHIPEYPFVVCKTCRFACVAKEVLTHLKDWHASIKPKERRQIAGKVSTIPDIIQDQAGLSKFEFPPPTTDPIPFIAAAKNDGLRCDAEACQYVTRTERGMRKHGRKEHGWTTKAVGREKQGRENPWTTGIQCQRFFRSRMASRWFEVGRAIQQPGEHSTQAEDIVERIKRIHRGQIERFETRSEDLIKIANDKTEPNAWLDRVGWAQHLGELDRKQLRELKSPIQDGEPVLQQMWESLERVINNARSTAVASKVGSPALFEVQRKEIHVKPNRPFDNRMEEDSWARYKDVWRQLLCILHRAQMGDEVDRPPYRLTKRQVEAYDRFADTVAAVVEDVDRRSEATEKRIDRMALELTASLLDHQFKQSHYDSAMISGLAVMGLRDDTGWVDAMNYTPTYSAVIKVARMLVVYQSVVQREDEVAEFMKRMDEDDAREQATAIFTIVRDKVQRFMTRTTESPSALPTPMDWIYECRTYGMHIRFNTPAGGTIDWEGERIEHRDIKFTMNQLSQMLQTLVDEARGLLAQLTMVEKEGVEGLPTIEWAKMEDDHGDDRVGYSFLQDKRNAWLDKGRDWVLRRILGSNAQKKAWFSEGVSDANPYKHSAVRKYGRAVEQFRERLWMMMHMVSGQPARSTEILGIRYVNTINGGVRNILAHNKMMCFVTSYHKNFRQSGQTKVIHRYLPREIGELLVWYLWLALPFWQQVQGIVKDADNRSPFLWSDEVVSRAEGEGETERRERQRKEQEEREWSEGAGQGREQGEGEEGMTETAGFKDWIKERKWTSDRARRIMQRHSERLMETKLGLSAWRQMAIAISNRYLHKAFKEEGFGDEDEDEVEDDPADLQAGHGTHVAGMIYARELQQGNFGTATRREQFRAVSRRWHRFLGFGAEDWGGTESGMKRQRDPFEAAREEARFRRFARLQQVDMGGQLRMMMGEKAEFRGQQEMVIRSIVRGESPVVQITGTGGGKSLSFMLPAYCSPEGTTIVIVPLVSLREDLHDRCNKSMIESHIWRSRGGNRLATITFVTPESAVTKGFRDYVNWLQSRQALDRIVVDECHVLLDGNDQFRPKLRELGPILKDWCVQKVFLTATLPPGEEAEFFRVAGLSASRVRMFRSRTRRKNIAYRVETVSAAADQQEEEEDRKVCQMVRRWMEHHADGRVIVYAGSTDRVERLAKALGCGHYHAKMDTVEGKARRLRAWRDDGRLVVATNALGLGVDVPDVRLVVHAGMPRRLRDYVQESGRGGRDGGRSEAVVVCRKARQAAQRNQARAEGRAQRANTGRGRQGQKKKDREENEEKKHQWEESVEAFVEGKWCRRQVLDKVMDGWMERTGCEADEEACDICTRRHWEAMVEEELAIKEEEEEEEAGDNKAAVMEEMERKFESQMRQSRFERWKADGEKMKAAAEVEEFKEQLERWAGRCVVCHLVGEGEVFHEMEACPQHGGETWTAVKGNKEFMVEGMFTKRRFSKHAVCFWCGLPQAICDRWEAIDSDNGRFRLVRANGCQYEGVVMNVYAGAYASYLEWSRAVMEQMMTEDGLVMEDGGEDGWFGWLGRKVKWAGMEANQLCRGFHRLCRLVEGEDNEEYNIE